MPSLPEHLSKLFPHEDQWGKEVGYELLEYDHGRVRTKLAIQNRHQSPSGAVHGGVISSFVDWSAGGVFGWRWPVMLAWKARHSATKASPQAGCSLRVTTPPRLFDSVMFNVIGKLRT